MTRIFSSRGRQIYQGHPALGADDQELSFVTSDWVPAVSGVPEVRHDLERSDRKERVEAVLNETFTLPSEALSAAWHNLMSLEDTFMDALEGLTKAIPYANEIESGRQLISGLISSQDQTQVKKRLGSSTVMYARHDHALLLWLVQGLQSLLPEEDAGSSFDPFLLASDDV